jgi:hypothetical protein
MIAHVVAVVLRASSASPAAAPHALGSQAHSSTPFGNSIIAIAKQAELRTGLAPDIKEQRQP